MGVPGKQPGESEGDYVRRVNNAWQAQQRAHLQAARARQEEHNRLHRNALTGNPESVGWHKPKPKAAPPQQKNSGCCAGAFVLIMGGLGAFGWGLYEAGAVIINTII